MKREYHINLFLSQLASTPSCDIDIVEIFKNSIRKIPLYNYDLELYRSIIMKIKEQILELTNQPSPNTKFSFSELSAERDSMYKKANASLVGFLTILANNKDDLTPLMCKELELFLDNVPISKPSYDILRTMSDVLSFKELFNINLIDYKLITAHGNSLILNFCLFFNFLKSPSREVISKVVSQEIKLVDKLSKLLDYLFTNNIYNTTVEELFYVLKPVIFILRNTTTCNFHKFFSKMANFRSPNLYVILAILDENARVDACKSELSDLFLINPEQIYNITTAQQEQIKLCFNFKSDVIRLEREPLFVKSIAPENILDWDNIFCNICSRFRLSFPMPAPSFELIDELIFREKFSDLVLILKHCIDLRLPKYFKLIIKSVFTRKISFDIIDLFEMNDENEKTSLSYLKHIHNKLESQSNSATYNYNKTSNEIPSATKHSNSLNINAKSNLELTSDFLLEMLPSFLRTRKLIFAVFNIFYKLYHKESIENNTRLACEIQNIIHQNRHFFDCILDMITSQLTNGKTVTSENLSKLFQPVSVIFSRDILLDRFIIFNSINGLSHTLFNNSYGVIMAGRFINGTEISGPINDVDVLIEIMFRMLDTDKLSKYFKPTISYFIRANLSHILFSLKAFFNEILTALDWRGCEDIIYMPEGRHDPKKRRGDFGKGMAEAFALNIMPQSTLYSEVNYMFRDLGACSIKNPNFSNFICIFKIVEFILVEINNISLYFNYIWPYLEYFINNQDCDCKNNLLEYASRNLTPEWVYIISPYLNLKYDNICEIPMHVESKIPLMITRSFNATHCKESINDMFEVCPDALSSVSYLKNMASLNIIPDTLIFHLTKIYNKLIRLFPNYKDERKTLEDHLELLNCNPIAREDDIDFIAIFLHYYKYNRVFRAKILEYHSSFGIEMRALTGYITDGADVAAGLLLSNDTNIYIYILENHLIKINYQRQDLYSYTIQEFLKHITYPLKRETEIIVEQFRNTKLSYRFKIDQFKCNSIDSRSYRRFMETLYYIVYKEYIEQSTLRHKLKQQYKLITENANLKNNINSKMNRNIENPKSENLSKKNSINNQNNEENKEENNYDVSLNEEPLKLLILFNSSIMEAAIILMVMSLESKCNVVKALYQIKPNLTKEMKKFILRLNKNAIVLDQSESLEFSLDVEDYYGVIYHLESAQNPKYDDILQMSYYMINDYDRVKGFIQKETRNPESTNESVVSNKEPIDTHIDKSQVKMLLSEYKNNSDHALNLLFQFLLNKNYKAASECFSAYKNSINPNPAIINIITSLLLKKVDMNEFDMDMEDKDNKMLIHIIKDIELICEGEISMVNQRRLISLDPEGILKIHQQMLMSCMNKKTVEIPKCLKMNGQTDFGLKLNESLTNKFQSYVDYEMTKLMRIKQEYMKSEELIAKLVLRGDNRGLYELALIRISQKHTNEAKDIIKRYLSQTTNIIENYKCYCKLFEICRTSELYKNTVNDLEEALLSEICHKPRSLDIDKLSIKPTGSTAKAVHTSLENYKVIYKVIKDKYKDCNGNNYNINNSTNNKLPELDLGSAFSGDQSLAYYDSQNRKISKVVGEKYFKAFKYLQKIYFYSAKYFEKSDVLSSLMFYLKSFNSNYEAIPRFFHNLVNVPKIHAKILTGMIDFILKYHVADLIPYYNQLSTKILDNYTKKVVQAMMEHSPYRTFWNSLILFNSRKAEIKAKMDEIVNDLSFEKRVLFQNIVQFADKLTSISKSNLKDPGMEDFPEVTQFLHNCNNFTSTVKGVTKLSTISPSSSINIPGQITAINSLLDEIFVFRSLQMPKKITMLGEDGIKYPMIVKSKDDLRKDSRFMDLNALLSKLFKDGIYIRMYNIIPFTHDSGILEFIPNLTSLKDIITKYHNNLSEGIYRFRKFKKIGGNNMQAICQTFPPVFNIYMIEKFRNPYTYYKSRENYIKTYATMCIVGWYMGLGDRHTENIHFDDNGDTVHVDLNCIFDKAKSLEIPETVPFRLTQNIIDGFGRLKLEGTFKNTMKYVLTVIKENEDAIQANLLSFVFDPLFEWARKKNESVKIMEGRSVKMKFEDVEEKVEELIEEATDINNLGALYIGWMSFL